MHQLESFIAAQGGIALLGWRRLAANDGCPVRGGRGVSGPDRKTRCQTNSRNLNVRSRQHH
jgi:hypothetical protein